MELQRQKGCTGQVLYCYPACRRSKPARYQACPELCLCPLECGDSSCPYSPVCCVTLLSEVVSV